MGAFINAENLKIEVGTNEQEGSFYIHLIPFNNIGEERTKIIIGAPSFLDEIAKVGNGLRMAITPNEHCQMRQNKIEIQVKNPSTQIRNSIFAEMQKTIKTWLAFWNEIDI